MALRCRIILGALAGQDNVAIAAGLGVRPIIWTATVGQIIEKIDRARTKAEQIKQKEGRMIVR